MSASLVGSEMCIRDSSLPEQPRRGRRRCRAGPASLGPSWGSGGGVVPVSYTHLTLPTICSV
eukprot:6675185-Alexandrium_andersonii.AAC.1